MGLFLLQMAGMSGMGKSTLARAIGANTGAMVVDVDVLKSAALDAGADWGLSAQVGYEGIRAMGEDLLRQGTSVILDSPCRFQRIVDEGIEIARRQGAAYGYVECALEDREELRRRMRTRKTLRSQGPDLGVPPPDAPTDSYATWLTETGEFKILPNAYPPVPWISIDTSRPSEECLARALEYVEALTYTNEL